MDRRVLGLILASALGCGRGNASSTSALDAGAAASAPGEPTPAVAPRGRSPAAAVDAGAAETPTGALPPDAVLTGAQAEQAIAELVTPRAPSPTALDGGAGSLVVTPAGVGPLRLGLTRAELLGALGRRARTVRVKGRPGEPTVEHADLRDGDGTVVARFELYAARVARILVLARDARLATDDDVMVGSTFADAERGHGEPRLAHDRSGAPVGWVFAALPGVVFVPADNRALREPVAPRDGKIARIVIAGPEAD